MDVLGTALRFVTGLPQPAVPAPVPTEIIARVPTIRTARGRGRGYGLGVERDRPRRVTRSTGVPLLAATPAPAASGAEFGFNPVIPEAAVGISRTVSVKMEEQELRERRRDTPKRKKAMKRAVPAKKAVNLGAFPEDILYIIMAEVAKEDPAFGRKANLVCRRWHIISHAVPSLWSHISICSGSSFHTAELYLERARVGPLTVYLRNLTLHEARIDKYFFNTAVALVKPHRKRITGLTIRTYTVNTLAHALGELVGKRGTSAPLRTLDISLCVPCPAAPLRGLLRYTMPAQLQSIRFDRALLANVGPPCALRSLHISRPEQWANNFQTLREFAATYPALRSLRIDNWDQQLPPVPHTGVRELAFPEVEELRLWKCRADNVHLLLAHLRTPRLNNVDIAFSSVPYQPNADGFQDLHGLALVQLAEIGNLASPHGDDRHARGIQTLTFANLQSSLAELLHVLKACKYLRSLSFTRCNLTNDPVNWLANPTPKGPWLAQYLESLKIDECGAVEGFAFRQFAFNRWTGAENKWCVRLKELEIRGCSRVTQKDVAFCRQRVEVVTFSQ